jgi:uncharacterized GH25 family protein
MKKHFKLAAAALAFSVYLPMAMAHGIWIEPSSTILSKAGYVTVSAGAGNDKFVYNHAPLRGAAENFTATAPDGSKVAMENFMQGKLRTVFDLNLTQNGTYRLTVVNRGIMASWKEAGQTKRFRGNAESFAKDVPLNGEELKVNESFGRLETFVTVGKPTPVKVTGEGLELLPLTPPNDLFAGEAATFQLLIDGKPAAQAEIEIQRGGSRYRNQLGEIKLKADGEGKFSYTWPEAGLYWLDADFKDDKTSVKQAKERRLSYIATFEVLPQ